MTSEPQLLEASFEDEFGIRADWRPLEFETAVDMLFATQPAFPSRQIRLHDWQKEMLALICAPVFTREDPLQLALVAANGSGKDAYVVGPFAAWHMVSKIRSHCYVTSASFGQLDTQTDPSIRRCCEAINRLYPGAIKINKFKYTCRLTGSSVLLRATDEPGRLEGEHPYSDYPNAEFAVIANEAKTVTDPMFDALTRCNLFNRWLEVSTPGAAQGTFYKDYRRATKYPEPFEVGKTRWYARTISAYDCPHISAKSIEDDKMKYGESSLFFRSKILAQFTELGENIIISSEMIEKCLAPKSEVKLPKLGVTAGVDLSGGGDEITLYLVDGNRIAEFEALFGQSDGIEIAAAVMVVLNKWKHEYGLRDENISIDDGGLGSIIIDIMRRSGLFPVRVLNQAPAILKDAYGNAGAEMYFNVKRIFEEGLFILDEVKHFKLIDQLRGRRQKLVDGKKQYLESKKDMRARGVHSPDHADAFVLACRKIRVTDLLGTDAAKSDLVNPRPKGYTPAELQEFFERGEMPPVEQKPVPGSGFFSNLARVVKHSNAFGKTKY